MCASALALLALSCSSSSRGGDSDTTVQAMSGNWIVDGSMIKVIQDTGAPHDVLDGDSIRIGSAGMEVLLNTYMQAGGAYDRFLKVLGGNYTVLKNILAAGKLDVSLLVDCSGAHSEPPGTLMLAIECTATLEGTQLKFSYLSKSIYKEEERERDELEFICNPVAAATADMTGTWETTGIKVFSDTGSAHPFKNGDQTIAAQEKITKLLGIDFTASGILGASPTNYDISGNYTFAGQGRAEAMFVAIGKKGTAADGFRQLLVFDAIRSGNAVIGDFLLIHDDGKVGDIDHLLVSLILKSSKQALLGSSGLVNLGFGAGAKKLVTAVLPHNH